MRVTGTRAIAWLILAILLAAVVFVGFPGIDLAVSRAVFLGDRQFLLTNSAFALAVNAAEPKIVVTTIAAIIGAFVARLRWQIPGLELRRVLFVALSFAVGPGLIVNAVLKEFWGRARPNDIVEFGGVAEFTPALLPADQCSGNCSFVSGDVAIAFAYVAIALLLPARWRPVGVAAALVLGFGIAVLRVLQGAHFLSDVVFAALFTLLPIALFAALILRPAGTPAVAVLPER